jgi:hypothetical protein
MPKALVLGRSQFAVYDRTAAWRPALVFSNRPVEFIARGVHLFDLPCKSMGFGKLLSLCTPRARTAEHAFVRLEVEQLCVLRTSCVCVDVVFSTCGVSNPFAHCKSSALTTQHLPKKPRGQHFSPACVHA